MSWKSKGGGCDGWGGWGDNSDNSWWGGGKGSWEGMQAMMNEWFGAMKGGWGGGPGGGGSTKGGMQHQDMVERVKQIQRDRSMGGYELWQAFCERRGGGKKDPAVRSVQDLQDFLREIDTGTADSSSLSGDPKQQFVNKVKHGQKSSEEFKQAWWNHCKDFGESVNDPAKHTEDFLQSFLEMAPSVEMPENDDEHQALVQQVKAGQRASEEYKQAWYSYCQTMGTQKYDPARHPSTFLQSFMAEMGDVPETPAPKPSSWKGSHRYNPY